MLRRGQNYEFCHIESHGKKKSVASLMKLQSASILLYIEPIYIVFIAACKFLKKIFKIFQWRLVTIALLFYSPCNCKIVSYLSCALGREYQRWHIGCFPVVLWGEIVGMVNHPLKGTLEAKFPVTKLW